MSARGPAVRATRSADEAADLPWPARLRRRLSPGWAGFARRARGITRRHSIQTRETALALRRRYDRPVLGRVRVWDLVERLDRCVDPTDGALYRASQLTHVAQVLAGMERERADDPDLVLAAFVHDLGKVLLLAGEDPAHVVGMNAPIGAWPAGIGLDRVLVQWNHDEFAYRRLVDHVPDHVAWLVRYHSVELGAVRPLMDARDRAYLERYLLPFRRYDQRTKSPWARPGRAVLDRHRHVVERAFPSPIVF